MRIIAVTEGCDLTLVDARIYGLEVHGEVWQARDGVGETEGQDGGDEHGPEDRR